MRKLTQITLSRVIEVDSPMAKVILLLNNKGYYTYMCCSGHGEYGISSYVTPCWIMFIENLEFLKYSSPGEKFLSLEKNGFIYSEFRGYTRIEYSIDGFHQEAIDMLMSWAQRLSPLHGSNMYRKLMKKEKKGSIHKVLTKGTLRNPH